MAYIIAEPCIGVKDASCVAVCPVDCIYEGEDQYYINPEECIDCGACEPECPVEAIFVCREALRTERLFACGMRGRGAAVQRPDRGRRPDSVL
jgi:NAD-dependent dihydropyrimidine dehydrogenase PreA subunit